MPTRLLAWRDTLKILAQAGLILAAAGLCLVPGPAGAAGKHDGSAPLLCVPIGVTECGAEGECKRGTAESVNLPQFIRVDLKAMTIRSEEQKRESPIKTVEHMNGKLVLQGTQGERGWTMLIDEDTGRLSATVTADGEGFVVFGACTVLP
jgi:hypothetical protein